jgi:hypothetical protein
MKMTQLERTINGHLGHLWNNAWPPLNLLKLQGGHRGHLGHLIFSIFTNVSQCSPKTSHAIKKTRVAKVANYFLTILYIIILYIYKYMLLKSFEILSILATFKAELATLKKRLATVKTELATAEPAKTDIITDRSGNRPTSFQVFRGINGTV